MIRILLSLGIVSVCLGFLAGQDRNRPSAYSSEPKAVQSFTASSVSCASSGCHAGGHSTKVGSEWNTWIEKDPHAKAYRVLFNETSVRIAKNLNARHAENQPVSAHENMTCLNCHGPLHSTASKPDGVGCEACHGNAKDYGTVHYLGFWKALSIEQKTAQYGLAAIKNLNVRAATCASCHIGAAGRDVNHDLIAAGHPRLLFEFSSFQHHPNYTKHWTESAADFEVRSWLIGQVAAARASVALLQSRLQQTEKKRIWPELAEFKCYSCHQPIRAGSGSAEAKPSKSEFVPVNEWSFILLPLLAKQDDLTPGFKADLQPLMDLRNAVSQNVGDIAALERRIPGTLRILDDWLTAFEKSPPIGRSRIERLLTEIVADTFDESGTALQSNDWEVLTPHYLAAAQLYYALGSSRRPELEPVLKEIRKQLYFAPGSNSPQEIPIDHGKLWLKLRDLLNSPSERQP